MGKCQISFNPMCYSYLHLIYINNLINYIWPLKFCMLNLRNLNILVSTPLPELSLFLVMGDVLSKQ